MILISGAIGMIMKISKLLLIIFVVVIFPGLCFGKGRGSSSKAGLTISFEKRIGAGTEVLLINNNSATPTYSVQLQASGTLAAYWGRFGDLKVGEFTTASRTSLIASDGTIVFDTDLDQLFFFATPSWGIIASGAGGTGDAISIQGTPVNNASFTTLDTLIYDGSELIASRASLVADIDGATGSFQFLGAASLTIGVVTSNGSTTITFSAPGGGGGGGGGSVTASTTITSSSGTINILNPQDNDFDIDIAENSISSGLLQISGSFANFQLLIASPTAPGGLFYASGVADLGFITSFINTVTATTSINVATGELFFAGSGSLVIASATANGSTTFTLAVQQDPELRGMSLQQSSLTLILATGTIYLDFEASGTGDITYLLDGEELVLDCTTGDGVGGKARVALVSGADLSTVSENFVVVRNIGGVASVVNHLTRPLGSFAWVGVFVLPDNSTFSTTGAYGSQRYTDSLLNDNRGALSHEREKTRFAGADYFSGVLPTVTILTDPSPDEVTISTESGEAYQLHRLPFPAFTGSATLFIANDSSTPFTTVTDLNGVLTDAAGDSLTNKRYVLTLWGSINAFDSKLFINLPNGSYSSDSEALADSANTAVTTVPNEFRQTAFLITKIVLRHQSAGGGTFTFVGTVDLRGQRPGFNVGSVSGSSSNSDALFEIRDNADDTKIMKFEVSGITTGNTRIYTVPDLDGTMALLSDLVDTITTSTTINITQGEIHIVGSGVLSIASFTGNGSTTFVFSVSAQDTGVNTITASPTALDTAEIDTTVSASNQISGDLIDDSIVEARLKIANGPQDYFILTASSTAEGGYYWASGTGDLGFITSFSDTNTITTSSTFELNSGGSDGPGNLNIIAAGSLSGAKTGSGASITFTLTGTNVDIWKPFKTGVPTPTASAASFDDTTKSIVFISSSTTSMSLGFFVPGEKWNGSSDFDIALYAFTASASFSSVTFAIHTQVIGSGTSIWSASGYTSVATTAFAITSATNIIQKLEDTSFTIDSAGISSRDRIYVWIFSDTASGNHSIGGDINISEAEVKIGR